MRMYRPQGLLAGFLAEGPELECPELQHVGEQWWPAGRLLSEHRHDCWELYLQLDGVSTWRVADQRYEVGADGLLAVAPDVEHAMASRPTRKLQFAFLAVRIEPILRRIPILRDHWPRGSICLPDAGALREPFRALISEVCIERPARGVGVRLALDYLLVVTARLLTAADERRHPIMHPAVEHARRLMEMHCEQDWQLGDLGRVAGLSSNHLAARFKQELGCTPRQFLLRERIRRARHTLRHSDRSVTQLALDLGFCSSQHFARTFRAIEGCTAGEYRRRG